MVKIVMLCYVVFFSIIIIKVLEKEINVYQNIEQTSFFQEKSF